MGSRTDRDVEVHEKGIAEIAGRPVRQIEGNDRGAAMLLIEATVQRDARDILDFSVEPAGQLVQTAADFRYADVLDVGDARIETGQAMDVLGSRFKDGREIQGHFFIEGMESAAAREDRPESQRFLPEADAAGSLGAVQAFVAGEAKDIDVLPPHSDVQYAGALGSVDDEQQIVFAAEIADPFQIYGVAGDVGGMVNYDRPGIGLQ